MKRLLLPGIYSFFLFNMTQMTLTMAHGGGDRVSGFERGMNVELSRDGFWALHPFLRGIIVDQVFTSLEDSVAAAARCGMKKDRVQYPKRGPWSLPYFLMSKQYRRLRSDLSKAFSNGPHGMIVSDIQIVRPEESYGDFIHRVADYVIKKRTSTAYWYGSIQADIKNWVARGIQDSLLAAGGSVLRQVSHKTGIKTSIAGSESECLTTGIRVAGAIGTWTAQTAAKGASHVIVNDAEKAIKALSGYGGYDGDVATKLKACLSDPGFWKRSAIDTVGDAFVGPGVGMLVKKVSGQEIRCSSLLGSKECKDLRRGIAAMLFEIAGL